MKRVCHELRPAACECAGPRNGLCTLMIELKVALGHVQPVSSPSFIFAKGQSIICKSSLICYCLLRTRKCTRYSEVSSLESCARIRIAVSQESVAMGEECEEVRVYGADPSSSVSSSSFPKTPIFGQGTFVIWHNIRSRWHAHRS